MRLTLKSTRPFSPVLLEAYVPTAVVPSVKTCFPLHVTQGRKTRYQHKKNHAVFTHEEACFPEDIYHLAGALSRALWLSDAVYSAHAACINGHLLIGPSGAGKTTVLRALIARGMKGVLSTNTALLRIKDGTLFCEGGTRAITGDAAQMAVDHSLLYGSRAAYMPPESIMATAPQTVKAIWFLRLDERGFACTPLSAPSAAHQFFPVLMNSVNSRILLGGGKALFQCADNPAAANLAPRLLTALSGITVAAIRGTAAQIAQHLLQEETLK